MADDLKIGTPWQDDELDAIVTDYFSMLDAELSGHPYVKAPHSAALMHQIGRTRVGFERGPHNRESLPGEHQSARR